ncbi:initiation control protein YabA [Lactococcus termiticola]|uniref:DNA replication initiation control protein YabA n=1 Tax=Lactococcus termiticola TaxID=2169526 RepID=A0A2R5HGK7_9LACT|nr:initiation control protein YabA [Lactococcus termiticola]GBG96475.1 DNA replication initiation control protein YabA [Lactococcus termiticola]
MPKDPVLKQLENLEEQLSKTLKEVSSIKLQFEAALSENTKLSVENENLRNRFNEEQGDREPTVNATLRSVYYDKGSHICNSLFGTSREGEECLICQEILYR